MAFAFRRGGFFRNVPNQNWAARTFGKIVGLLDFSVCWVVWVVVGVVGCRRWVCRWGRGLFSLLGMSLVVGFVGLLGCWVV